MENQKYYSNVEVLQPNDEDINFILKKLGEYIMNPELYFNSLELEKDKKNKKYKDRRRVLSQAKDTYLGMGNNGFVASTKKTGKYCYKYVWDKLNIFPGKNISIEDLKSYGEDVFNLYKIMKAFDEAKSKNLVLKGDNRDFIPSNPLILEAVIQDVSSRILKEIKAKCIIPKVAEVDFLELTEDDDSEYGYNLDEKCTTMTMDRIKGLSIQDLIESYPDSSEYIERINFEEFSVNLVDAIKKLHSFGIKHQDLTARNIMVDFKTGFPVIIDFGKAVYGSGHFSEQEERENLGEVLRHLREYVLDPAKKKISYSAEYKKRNQRFSIDNF